MELNKLYFLKDEYFAKYKDKDNKPNKQKDDFGEHNRPCYYAFKEDNIYWMIPVSSQYTKYERLYQSKTQNGKDCDTIVLGYVKGNKNAFLIQNMIPVTEKYINNLYLYKGTDRPVEVNDKKCKEINAKVRKVLRFARNGIKLTFTPILDIEKALLMELEQDALLSETAVTKE